MSGTSSIRAGRGDDPGRRRRYTALAISGIGLAVLAGASCVFGLLTADAHDWSAGLAWVSFLVLPVILLGCAVARRGATRAGDRPARRTATAGIVLSAGLILLIAAFAAVLVVAVGSLE